MNDNGQQRKPIPVGRIIITLLDNGRVHVHSDGFTDLIGILGVIDIGKDAIKDDFKKAQSAKPKSAIIAPSLDMEKP